jgi:hypothetical protein
MNISVRHCSACGKPRPATEEFCPYCTAPPVARSPRARSQSSAIDTGLECRWGGGPDNPTLEELQAALVELDTPDEEHPNAWLTDADGWTVDVYEHGLVIFSSNEETIVERRGVSREEALELWLLLQRGARDEIRDRLLRKSA